MSNLLKLYTYWNDLEWETVPNDEGEKDINKSTIYLRDGEKVVIHEMVCPFEETGETLYIISGGYTYEDFTTIQEAERFLMELQRKPNLLYESTGEF